MRTRETASAHGAAAHGAPPGHLGSPRSKATTVRPQLTGGVARRLRRGARRSGQADKEERKGTAVKICLLNSSFFLTQTVTFQKNENWEMVRKWVGIPQNNPLKDLAMPNPRAEALGFRNQLP